jgi:hypothetical protein
MPSPQIAMQRAPIAGQIHPGSIRQFSVQPSPDVRLWSSHVSAPPTRPSPQEIVQVQGCPGAAQSQSVSVLQSGEQPSPPFVFASSQVSAGRSNVPFPHGGTGQSRPVAGSHVDHRSTSGGRSAAITSRRASAAPTDASTDTSADASTGAVSRTLAAHPATVADITAAATAVLMAPARARPDVRRRQGGIAIRNARNSALVIASRTLMKDPNPSICRFL